MKDWIQLCRPYYAVPMALAYMLTVFYARGGQMEAAWPQTVASTLALLAVISGAYVLNDACDRIADQVNAPTRPVAANRIGRRTAACVGTALLLAGPALGLAFKPNFGLALTTVAILLVLYDLASKRLGVGKQVLVAALMTSIYPLSVIQADGATGRRAGSLAIFPAWLFLTSFGYELLKDLRDLAGDRLIAGPTASIQRNPLRWRRVAAATILAGAALLPLPCLAGCRWLYLVGAVLAMLAAMLAAVLPPRRSMIAVYVECITVGIAATADVMVFGS